VAGRAGRRTGNAEVIFQSYQPEHYAIQAAARYDRQLFYDNEIAYRQRLGYPPFARMIKTHRHGNIKTTPLCQQNAQHEATPEIAPHSQISHPATRMVAGPCFFARVRDRYRWQLFIVTNQPREVIQRIHDCHHAMIECRSDVYCCRMCDGITKIRLDFTCSSIFYGSLPKLLPISLSRALSVYFRMQSNQSSMPSVQALPSGRYTLSARPPDDEHAYGHDKAEYFSSGIRRSLNRPVATVGYGVYVGHSVCSILNLLLLHTSVLDWR
jgi:hypothetical protein